MDYTNRIKSYIQAEIDVLHKLDLEQVNLALNALQEAFDEERNIYSFGNGGSSATASHFQNDFNKGISEFTQKKFRVVCLNDNVPTIMAIANDIGFDEVFRFQLQEKVRKGDIVVAISGSGNSENVVCAVKYAKEQGAKIISLTGFDGGKLKKLSDISLHAPTCSMQITEDIHMIFNHLMMSVFYKTLCDKEHLAV